MGTMSLLIDVHWEVLVCTNSGSKFVSSVVEHSVPSWNSPPVNYDVNNSMLTHVPSYQHDIASPRWGNDICNHVASAIMLVCLLQQLQKAYEEVLSRFCAAIVPAL